MGCSTSKVAQTVDDSAMLRKPRGARPSVVAQGYKVQTAKDAAAPELQQQVAAAAAAPLPLPPAGCSMRYALLSQRGYYPDSPNKTNQDAMVSSERLGGRTDTHLWGVFDGHGEFGTECAQFVQQQLPAILAAQPTLGTAPEQALQAALLAVNAQLHASPIDDSLSGTTACCAVVQGDILYVANVGDSRAVVAERVSQPGGEADPAGQLLEARDLSLDQTPFRADECLRVLQAGARVMTLDQLEGLKDPGLPCWTNEADCDGDPPRLWSPHGMYPGTAFTRSVGDAAAESIGVIAEPEVSATRLGPQHAFAVVATDGVWEFISSQRAVEIVSQHTSPADAAKALVAQAYKLWLQRETRTDDITAAVLFFDWPQHPATADTACFLKRVRSARRTQQQQEQQAQQQAQAQQQVQQQRPSRQQQDPSLPQTPSSGRQSGAL